MRRDICDRCRKAEADFDETGRMVGVGHEFGGMVRLEWMNMTTAVLEPPVFCLRCEDALVAAVCTETLKRIKERRKAA